MKSKVCILILSLFLLVGCNSSDGPDSLAAASVSADSTAQGSLSSDVLPCDFTPENLPFLLQNAQPYDFQSEVHALILPHHMVAASMIVSALSGAAESRHQTDTVVIFAPNHSGLGGNLLTTLKGYSAPDGSIANQTEITERFLSQAVGAVINDETLSGDHSAAALIPFVRATFPNAKIAVLLFSLSATPEQVSLAARSVAEYAADHEVLLIGSIDFSHGLTPLYADSHDQYTASLLTENGRDLLFQLGNTHLDSPHTAAGVLDYISKTSGEKLVLIDHANALFFLKNDTSWHSNKETTTSYMIFADSALK